MNHDQEEATEPPNPAKGSLSLADSNIQNLNSGEKGAMEATLSPKGLAG